jgi:hypothetical protein
MVAAPTGSSEAVSDDPEIMRYALLMEPSDQAVGQFAPSEMEVNEGYAWGVLREQALGLGRSCGWSDHARS